jgi:hypothetical protein
MKKFIELNTSDGYEPQSRCRREAISARWELLTAFFDGPPFWMVRLRGLKQADRDYLKLGDDSNGHWRFLDKDDAQAKFDELRQLPKYAAEALVVVNLRDSARQRAREAIRAGKLTLFRKDSSRSAQNARTGHSVRSLSPLKHL